MWRQVLAVQAAPRQGLLLVRRPSQQVERRGLGQVAGLHWEQERELEQHQLHFGLQAEQQLASTEPKQWSRA